jgi:hypothetical protein
MSIKGFLLKLEQLFLCDVLHQTFSLMAKEYDYDCFLFSSGLSRGEREGFDCFPKIVVVVEGTL